MPKTGLPLPVPAHLVAGFAEAAVEAQVVSDGVLPTIRSRLEEGEVLPVKDPPDIFVNVALMRVIRGGGSLLPGKLVNLLDLQAPSVAALERQSDEDAVVDRRTRPTTWFQVLKVLEGDKKQVETF